MDAVIALGEVFNRDLPIACQRDNGAAKVLQLSESWHKRLQLGLYALELFIERECFCIEINQHHRTDLRHRDRWQPDAVLVEAGDVVGVGCSAQPSVQAVAPGVVRTNDSFVESPLTVKQAMAPVATDIRETAQHAIVASNRNHVLLGDSTGEVTAGLLDIDGVPDELPAMCKNGL